MKKRALYIGRFQPFHLGHLDAVEQILSHPEEFDEIIIAIGSAENDFLLNNPLTCSERCELIQLALEEADIALEKIWIMPVRNLDRYSLWPYHVMNIVPHFTTVFSGSPLVEMLWNEALQRSNRKFIQLQKNIPVSATEVRNRIITGQEMDDLVPKKVQVFLHKLKLKARLRNMKM